MKHNLLIAMMLLSTFFSLSQNYVDILKVQAGTTPLNKFDSGSTKTRINELVTDLSVPVKINEKLSIISGLIYEQFQASLFAESGTRNFGSITLKLGVNKQFNERWSGTFVILPKLASDYVSLGSKDFQLGGIGILKHKKSDHLNYKLGLYYNNELFGPFFVPLAGFYYLSRDKKLEANVMLPLQADINYKLHSRLNAGFNFNGQIRSYHLTNVVPGHQSTYVAKSTNEFYLYLKFNLSKSFSLLAKAGQSLGRSYRVYDENDKVSFGLPAMFFGPKRQQLNTDFSDGRIFQVALLYRFNLNKP